MIARSRRRGGEERPGRSARRARALLRRHRGRIVWATLVLVLGFFGVELLVANFDEVLGAFEVVSHPVAGWLGLAILAEIASYVTYAAGQKRLLSAQGRPLGLPRLTLLAIAAQALGVCVPAGYAWSNVLSYRVLRRWRVDEITAGRALFMSALLYVAALALLALVGAQLTSGSGPAHDVRIAAYVLLGILALVLGALILRPGQLRRVGARTLARLERILARRGRQEGLERLREQLAEARAIDRESMVVSGGWLFGAWIGDIACLMAAFAAVGSEPPWRGLLLAYCGAQLAALLPITPGGLGVVEGSLTLALVSFGGAKVSTVAAVLLYRLISFWGLIPAGAASFGLLKVPALRAGGRLASEAAP